METITIVSVILLAVASASLFIVFLEKGMYKKIASSVLVISSIGGVISSIAGVYLSTDNHSLEDALLLLISFFVMALLILVPVFFIKLEKLRKIKK